jgi:hypothetical protein
MFRPRIDANPNLGYGTDLVLDGMNRSLPLRLQPTIGIDFGPTGEGTHSQGTFPFPRQSKTRLSRALV